MKSCIQTEEPAFLALVLVIVITIVLALALEFVPRVEHEGEREDEHD
jgi:hypothetical protein